MLFNRKITSQQIKTRIVKQQKLTMEWTVREHRTSQQRLHSVRLLFHKLLVVNLLHFVSILRLTNPTVLQVVNFAFQANPAGLCGLRSWWWRTHPETVYTSNPRSLPWLPNIVLHVARHANRYKRLYTH